MNKYPKKRIKRFKMPGRLVILRAIDIRRKGDYEKSIKLLEPLQESSIEAQLELGHNYIYSSNFSKALEIFERILSTTKSKTIEIRALYGVAIIFSNIGEYDDATFLLKSILQSEETDESLSLIVNSNIELSRLLLYQGKGKEAIEHVRTAHNLATRSKNSYEIAKAEFQLGLAAMVRGEYTQAIDYFKDSIVLFNKTNEKKRSIRAKNHLAEVFGIQGKYNIANEILQDILFEAREKVKDPILSCYIESNIALMKKHQGFYQESYELFESILHKLTVLEDREGMSRTLVHVGSLLSDMGDQGKAIESFRKAAEFFEEMGNKVDLVHVVGEIARTQFSLGQLSLSQAFFNQALDLYKETGSEFNLVKHFTTYSELLMEFGPNQLIESKNILDNAIDLVKKHNSPRESIMCQITKAIYEIYSHNFGYAKKTLKLVMQEVEMIKAYDDKIRVYILLAELRIIRYQIRFQQHDIDKAMENIVIAEELADQQGLVPQFLDILMLKATLYSFKLDFDVAINTLLDVQMIAEKKHLIGHQQRAEILLLQIRSRAEFNLKGSLISTKIFSEYQSIQGISNYYSTKTAPLLYRKNIIEQYAAISAIKPKSTSILIFEITGGMPNLVAKQNFDGNLAELAQFGVYYSLALGQGFKIRNGLHGPLPTPQDKERLTLIYTEELFGNTFMLCFILPKINILLFENYRLKLIQSFSKIFKEILNKRETSGFLDILQQNLEQLKFN